MQEWVLFLKRWLLKPMRLGVCFPSSKALGRLMAQCALEEWNGLDDIIEVGAGTGRFTQALLDAGIPPERLISIELDTQLAAYLKKKFPQVRIIEGNACMLRDLLSKQYPNHRPIGVIVSGLPMLAFPKDVQNDIMTESFNILGEEGSFIQFTYSPVSSINSQRFGLLKRKRGWVLGNFPPANVWSYKRCA